MVIITACVLHINFLWLSQTPPTADEAGYCDNVYIDEIGDTAVIVFRQSKLM